MRLLEITFGRPIAEIESEISELYLRGWGKDNIAQKVGLAESTVGRHLTKMFKAGEICPIGVHVRTRRSKYP